MRKGPRGWHTAILVSEIEASGLVVGSAGDVAHVDELSAAATGLGCRRKERQGEADRLEDERIGEESTG